MPSSGVVHVTQLRAKYWTLFNITSTHSFDKCSCKGFRVVRGLFLTNLTIFRIIRVDILRGRPDLCSETKFFVLFYYQLNRRLWCIQSFAYIYVTYSSFMLANNSTFYVIIWLFTLHHDIRLRTNQTNRFLPKMNLIVYSRICCSFKNIIEHSGRYKIVNMII